MSDHVVLAIQAAPGLMWESWEPALAYLRAAGFRVTDGRTNTPLGAAALAAMAADAHALIVGMERVTQAMIEAAPHLKVIGKPGAGVDNIDLAAASARGILVCNTAGSNAEAVADHTYALILASLRRLPTLDHLTRRGEGWNPWPPIVGGELWGKTLGVVGTGNTGRAVIRRAAGFALNVLAFDVAPCQELLDAGVRYVAFEQLLAESDLITVHIPLQADTWHLFDAQAFARMKTGSYFFNLSRGPIVDEQALAAALESGRLAGAGLDVFENEPVLPDNPLLKFDSLVATPHVAGFSREAILASRLQLAEVVTQALRGHIPSSLVNPDVLSVGARRECRRE